MTIEQFIITALSLNGVNEVKFYTGYSGLLVVKSQSGTWGEVPFRLINHDFQRLVVKVKEFYDNA
jgi:hypothetical protein